MLIEFPAQIRNYKNDLPEASVDVICNCMLSECNFVSFTYGIKTNIFQNLEVKIITKNTAVSLQFLI